MNPTVILTNLLLIGALVFLVKWIWSTDPLEKIAKQIRGKISGNMIRAQIDGTDIMITIIHPIAGGGTDASTIGLPGYVSVVVERSNEDQNKNLPIPKTNFDEVIVTPDMIELRKKVDVLGDDEIRSIVDLMRSTIPLLKPIL